LKSAISYLDDIGFTCYFPGQQGELWRITDCWQDHYSGIFWSNVACVHRDLAPALFQRMEQIFLALMTTTTTETTIESPLQVILPLTAEPPIHVTYFQNHNISRYDQITLLDSSGNSRYNLGIMDRTLKATTTHATCVWANDLPYNRKRKVRRMHKMIQGMAYQYNCIRMIVLLEKPPNVDTPTMMRELHHTVNMISQVGIFIGVKRRTMISNPSKVFWIWNNTI
jgi:hypothetical protein